MKSEAGKGGKERRDEEMRGDGPAAAVPQQKERRLANADEIR